MGWKNLQSIRNIYGLLQRAVTEIDTRMQNVPTAVVILNLVFNL